MLTHGKKVWGIWDKINNHFTNYSGNKGGIEIFDDANVAQVHLDLLGYPDQYEIRVISNGTIKPHEGGAPLETKINCEEVPNMVG